MVSHSLCLKSFVLWMMVYLNDFAINMLKTCLYKLQCTTFKLPEVMAWQGIRMMSATRATAVSVML